jgi:hypothetical protein
MIWLIVLLVVVAAVAVVLWQWQSVALKRRFGPEYERVVGEVGDRRSAVAELRGRVQRRRELDLRELTPDERGDYAARWLDVQASFVDDPATSVAEAHALVGELMLDRGYPRDGVDERIALVSVDHPELAESYRVAHRIESPGETAPIDDLRRAFQRYREVFTMLQGGVLT